MDLYWQDDSDNITRFLVLAREPILPGTDRPFKVIAEITGLNASYVTPVFLVLCLLTPILNIAVDCGVEFSDKHSFFFRRGSRGAFQGPCCFCPASN